jgi:hypothetical protein
MTLPVRWRLAVIVALAVYAVAALLEVSRHRDLMNPDAISYLLNARHVSRGEFAASVSGVWSPLVSWCVAPLLAAGQDGLHSLYAVLALWGAVLIFFAALLVKRATEIDAGSTLVVLLLVVDATLKWAVTSWPDVILAACLIAAGATVANQRFTASRWLQVQCGLWGGLAYLGKAYGLPYFMVLLPLSIAILHGARVGRRKAVSAWLVAGLTALALSAPWIAALSWKFGRPTYGLAGSLNHAIVGPEDFSRDELWTPVEGRLTVWEIPETRRYHYWSPFESAAHFEHQVAFSWATSKRIRDSVARFDYLALSLGLVVLAPFVLLALGERKASSHAWWFLAVAVAYCAPLALVNYEYRYVMPFLKPWCIVACFHLATIAGRRFAVGWLLPAVVAASFAAHLNVPFAPYTYQNPDGTSFENVVVDSRLHRRIAGELLAMGVEGPVASTSYYGGMFVGYFMDRPFVGMPAGPTFESCNAEIASVGARTFLVDPDWKFAPSFRADPDWSLRGTVDVGDGRTMEVLARRRP